MTADPAAPADLPYRPCVGVALLNGEGLLFAGQRIDNPGPAWQMPQGGIDPGEAPQEAALRELAEETGITPDLVRIEDRTRDWLRYDLPEELQGELWGGRYRGQKQLWFLMRYLGRDDQVDIATQHPEFSRWCWMAADDLAHRIVPFKRDLYREVIAAFRPHLA